MSRFSILKGALHLLFLTVFITYSSLYARSYVNRYKPTASSRAPPPLPQGYGTSEYVDRPNGNSKVTGSDIPDVNIKNVNNAKVISDQHHIAQNNIASETNINNAISNFFEKDNDGSQVSLPGTMMEEALPTSDELMENVESKDLKEDQQKKPKTIKFYDEYSDIDISDDDDDAEEEEEEEEETEDDSNSPVWPIVLEHSNASALLEMDLKKYSLKEREFLESRRRIMEERASLVERVCRGQLRSLHKPSGANHLVWDTRHDPNIVWCPNYKVASTSMMMSFLRVSTKEKKLQKTKKRVKQSDVRDLYWRPKTSAEKARILRDSVRVIIVRHPFTRILSAYRDKMRKMKPGPKKFQFRKIQKEIIAKYRDGSRPSPSPSDDSRFPTFPEFVDYVIDETRSLTSSQDWKDKVRCWVAYWAHCNVCTTDYTVIMKLETMEEDKKFLVTLSDMKELKEKSPKDWLHLRNATSKDLAPKYYSQLTQDQILNLYNNYKLDFELFDYSINDYLNLV